MEFEKKDVAAGAFIVAALAVFAGILFAVNRTRLVTGTYHIQIRLANIAGIDKGAEVVYKGYKAGTVDKISITYEPEFRFDVRLAISEEIRLRRGTIVVVKGKGFGAARYLELQPPLPGGPDQEIEEGSLLQAVQETDLMARAHEVMGDIQSIIGNLDKTGTAGSLQEVLRQAKTAMTSLDRALVSMTALMEENRAALKKTLAETQGISEKTNRILTSREGSIDRTLENVDKASSHLPGIMKGAEELTSELKRHPWRLLRKGGPEIPDLPDAPAQKPAKSTAPAGGAP